MSEPRADHPAPDALADFRDGKLGDADSAAVAAHLAVCPACRRAAENAGRRSAPAGLPRRAGRSGTLVPGTPSPAPADPPSGRSRPSGSGTMLPGGPPPAPATVLRGRPGTVSPGSPPSAPADLPPELANHPRYRVLKELGRGGMGTVYQAEQVVMHRQVAIKVISPSLLEHPDALERFNREVQAAAKLSHPNIVTAHDAEQAGGLHMLVMEYVEGQSLDRALEKKGPLAVAHACHFVRQAALGLQHAHEQGMVHRDIKPQNLMLTPKGQVKILDFGLAKAASERGQGKGLTAVNAYMGTPEYSAPEQAADARSADIRADIYSLGCTLYALLAGHPPFQEDTDVKTILAHIEQDPQPLPELRPDVPAELWAVVLRMLAKDPAQRYQEPVEVAQALVPFCKPGGKAAGTPTPVPAAVRAAPTKPVSPAGQTKEQGFEFADEPEKTPSQRAGAGKRKPGRSRMPLLIGGGAALAVVLVAVVLGVVLRSKTKGGTVVLEIDQPGAEVSVDGNPIPAGNTGKQEPIQINAEEGLHHLRVAKDGFVTVAREFTVKAGVAESIIVTLKPAAVVVKDISPAHPPAEQPAPPAAPDAPATGGERIPQAQGEDDKAAGHAPPPDATRRAAEEPDPEPAKPAAQANDSQDRRVARNILELGGTVRIVTGEVATSIEIRHPADLPEKPFLLAEISLRGEKFYEGALLQMKGLEHLTRLDIPNDKGTITDAGLECLEGLTTLEYLNLFGQRFNVTRARLAHLRELKNLHSLLLGGTNIDDEGLGYLGELSGLVYLGLAGTRVSDKGLPYLRGLPRLEALRLDGTKVTDTGLTELGRWGRLRQLWLSGTRITDAGMPALAGLRNLKELDIGNTSVSDKGLYSLGWLKGLNRLGVAGTKVSAKGIARFKAAVPKCRVDQQRGSLSVVRPFASPSPEERLGPAQPAPCPPRWFFPASHSFPGRVIVVC